MKVLVLVSVLCASCSFCTNATPFARFEENEKRTNVDPGSPLLLTYLIEQGKIDEARNASKVFHGDFQGIASYSGYFTVNETFDSNLFFWFFPAQVDYENAPVLLWLQGGPGWSSLYGLFVENGPFKLISENEIVLRNYSWAKYHSVIYIDNPAGVGFSYTNPGGFCRDQTQVGEELYQGLLQFFNLFPELQKNNFFATGESYAGKYLPAVSYTIHKKNPTASFKINLKGISIGNGYSDPINQNRYSDYLYQLGLLDQHQKNKMKIKEDSMLRNIKTRNWTEAANIFEDLMEDLYVNFTGASNYYNYLTVKNPADPDGDYLRKFVERDDIRAALHVGKLPYHTTKAVHDALYDDMPKSVAPWISELLDHYRILLYNGQLDVIVAYPLMINYLEKLDFPAAEYYKVAPRYKWYVNEELAGYVKEAGNLTEVLVRNAGHMVPYDQPNRGHELIYKFVRNIRLY